jgi:predicted ATPase
LDHEALTLVGANGSGKSNFIQSFEFLRSVRNGTLQQYTAKRGGAEKIVFFGSKTTKAIEFEISFSDRTNGYRVNFSPTDDDKLSIKSEICWFWDKRYPNPLEKTLTSKSDEAAISQQSTSEIREYVRKHLESWRVYHFHDTSSSSPMKKTADINDNRFYRPDGSNIAPYLYLLKQTSSNAYSHICSTIRKIAPFFRDFHLEPLRLNPDKIKLEWLHTKSENYFDASSLSDGTLRFICLAVLFLQPKDQMPSVILVDEPELGLHPSAIHLLYSMIRSASTNVQVIISTQSPILLDYFNPSEVLVAEQIDGATKLSRLDSLSLKEWLEDYSLGELWEKNLIGGKPNNA